MIECPRCGSNIYGSEQECFECGYVPNWEDFVDYDSIDSNIFDKILEYSSDDIVEIVRERKMKSLNVVGSIVFCPDCRSVMKHKNILVNCPTCGYSTKLHIDKTKLFNEIWNENYVTSKNIINNYQDPDFLWFLLENEYLDRNIYDKSLLCYEKAIEINDSHHYYWSKMIEVLWCLKEYDELLSCYDVLLNLSYTPDEVWSGKGDCFYEMGNFGKALQCYENALKINEYNSYCLTSVGDCYYKLEEYEKALNYYLESLNWDYENDYIWFQKALVHEELEEYDLMLECYELVLDIDPNEYNAWFMGVYYDNNKEYSKAIECYSNALKIEPNFEEAWIYKGECCD